MAELLDGRYADCAKVTLVCDNLNTHTKGAFYEAFEPERARGYVQRIDFCHTPKHGSWLNVAECELSCLTRQCLGDRRIGELTELQIEIAAWSEKTNAKQRGVDWQFRIDNARTKLKRLYPRIKT
jgi:DDE superfamily endonuclease